MRKNVLKILIGSIILEAVLACFFILIGSFDEVTWRTLGSVAVIFGYSIPCLFYSEIYNDEKYRYLAVAGASLASISALISIIQVWGLTGEAEFLGKFASTNIVTCIFIYIVWRLAYVAANNILSLFKKISIVLSAILSLYIIAIIWIGKFPEGFGARLFFVMIVLTLSALVCIAILIKIYAKEISNYRQTNKGTIDDSNNNQEQIQISIPTDETPIQKTDVNVTRPEDNTSFTNSNNTL